MQAGFTGLRLRLRCAVPYLAGPCHTMRRRVRRQVPEIRARAREYVSVAHAGAGSRLVRRDQALAQELATARARLYYRARARHGVGCFVSDSRRDHRQQVRRDSAGVAQIAIPGSFVGEHPAPVSTRVDYCVAGGN